MKRRAAWPGAATSGQASDPQGRVRSLLTARCYCKFVFCSESPEAFIYRADAAGFIAPRFIVRRWEEFTGKQATREADGEVLDQAASDSSTISQ